MRLLIVIVNYRTADLVIDCLDSIAGEMASLAEARVVVTDNDSRDGSVERLGEALAGRGWPWVTIKPLPRNGGFCYGNNAALREDLKSDRPADYYLLLNPDTLARAGAIGGLLRFMEGEPRAGVAGSLLEYPDGRERSSLHRAPTPLRELDRGARIGALARLLGNTAHAMPARNGTETCDWVSGASMMVRREVFEKVGLLDEGYFLYFDEVDFCTRVWRAGWGVYCVVDSRVVHLEGASTGIQEKRNRRTRHWYESRRRFLVKFYGARGLLLADALWATGRAAYLLRRALRLAPRPATDPKRFTLDLLGGDLRALLTGQLRRLPRERSVSRPAPRDPSRGA